MHTYPSEPLPPSRLCWRLGATLLVGAALALATTARAAETVPTRQGLVQGSLDPSGQVWRYLGIPFAASTAGENRFAPPQPAPHRDDVYVADTFPPACPQRGDFAGSCTRQSEDCLALNVFSPAWGPRHKRLPVMVYLHGGGFTGGCSEFPIFDATSLAAKRAVVVTLQYRVGLLGGIAVEELIDGHEPGAGVYGLLDQIAALRWVQRNIRSFGGDPHNVTVFGESAGGVSVCMLLASPLADDLFDRAVMMSGACDFSVPLHTTPGTPVEPFTRVTLGEFVASSLGCAPGDGRVDCLRSLPVEAILAAQAGVEASGANLAPAIDGAVLPELPIRVLEEHGSRGRDLIAGATRDENTTFVDPAFIPTILSDYDAAFMQAIPVFPEISAALLEVYPAPDDPADNLEQFNTALGELFFNCDAQEAVEAVVKRRTRRGHRWGWRHPRRGRGYLYHFTRAPFSPDPGVTALGSFHFLDQYYLFGQTAFLPPWFGMELEPEDDALVEEMQRAVVGFARHGRPGVRWPLYHPRGSRHYVFDIGDVPSVQTHYREGRCVEAREAQRSVDGDLDFIPDSFDNCPLDVNTSQIDSDGDGIGDRCDHG